MKILWTILIVSIFTSALKAQQVTSVDCCVDVGNKAMIIINDNTTNANAPNSPSAKPSVDKNGKCDFQLTVSSNTSAGVYDASDKLIRTLWSGVRYDAGCYSLQWDGMLDDGTQAPLGSYNIKILTNNVKYEWEVGIGNTTNRNHILKNYGGIYSIAAGGNKIFLGNSFYEGEPTSKASSSTNIQDVNEVNVGVGIANLGTATDGTNTYWLGTDQYQNAGTDGYATNYFHITKSSDNSEVNLSGATQHPSGRPGTPKMVLGWYAAPLANQYSGITVTKGAGGFIFISRADQNAVYVFSKQTGSLLQTVTVSNPSLLATAGTKIWIKSNNSLLLYDVNGSTGNLTATSTALSNLNITGLAANSDGSLMKYADADSRTIKTCNGQSGAFISSFGRVNGYAGNPNVTDDAFSFYYPGGNVCITFADDNSYWVNDPGNFRLMHFSANNAYVEQIGYVPSFRSINADPNNPSRVFINELEYAINYTKPLDNGANGSWKLVKNWKENTVLDGFRKFDQTITFPNGKMYAKGSLNNRLYWLDDNNGAVDVGAIPDAVTIQPDGSIYQRINDNNQRLIVQKAALTGYSGNMPSWGNFTPVVTTPLYNDQQPYFFYGSNNVKGSSTNSNREFFFNPWWGSIAQFHTGYGYHLGSIKLGENAWNWQASKSTFDDYHGDYPRNGDFDIGNNDFLTQHSENCQLLVQGSDLFWNVNAEFWQSSGVNIWNHFNEDGLLVGNFGVTGPQAAVNGEQQMAGNSFSTALVKVGADYYIYHCDESRWASGHRWKVSGLNTLKEVSIPVTVAQPVNEYTDPTNLMVGLPYRSAAFTGGNGWSVQQGISLVTNKLQYTKSNLDISLGGPNNLIITRDLNNKQSLNSWKLTGGINYLNGELTFGNAPDGSDNFNYLEILDVNGKVISRFIGNQADTRNNYYPRVWFNKTLVAEGAGVNTVNKYFFRDISFNYVNGRLTFKHQDYQPVSVTIPFENGADMSRPAIMRVNQGGNRTRYINLYKLRFSSK